MSDRSTLPEAREFISVQIGHAKGTSLAKGGYIEGVPGVDPWVYLYGTHGHKVTKTLLDARFNSYYKKHGWTRERYDEKTANWPAEGKIATDCEGLWDNFAGIDVNADHNYRKFCTQKGLIAKINRPFVIGEAVFNGSAAKKTHVGWVCGFTKNGTPLVLEARGLAYGVVITSMAKREWKYRGLMAKCLNYAASAIQPGVVTLVFGRTLKYGCTGDDVVELKRLLIARGYCDGISVDGRSAGTFGASTRKMVRAFQADAGLTIDGKAGKKTVRALGGNWL